MSDQSFKAGPDDAAVGQVALARRLADRLERLSADSVWAHRASGLRGSLLRWLEAYEQGKNPETTGWALLDRLVKRAFEVLTQAAREIGDPK